MTLKKVHVIFAWEVMATLELFQWESEGREGEGGKWREKIGKTVPLWKAGDGCPLEEYESQITFLLKKNKAKVDGVDQ